MDPLLNLPKKICSVNIDTIPFSFEVQGDFFIGEPITHYKSKGNLIEYTPWENEGFSIINAFSKDVFKTLQTSIKQHIIKGIELAEIEIDPTKFKLEEYHKYITTQEQHLAVIDHTRNLRNEDFDIDIEKLANDFSKHVQFPLTSYIKNLGRSHIQIRISRPNSLDINPPHRDGYLDYWKDILNIWIPIAGCDQNSSLPVVPSSHLIPENEIIRTQSKGAYINGNQYYVPCIIETTKGPFKMIRPNPKTGEALIFTPFLIHGAAVNKNKDTTRIALELRFDKKND